MELRTVFQGNAHRIAGLALAVLAAALMVPAGVAQTQPSTMQPPSPLIKTPDNLSPSQQITIEMPAINAPLTIKQKDAIIKSNFKTTEHDVATLSKLVQMLDSEMKKSNPNVLSVSIVRQANKIEKLAKKIKNEAKAY